MLVVLGLFGAWREGVPIQLYAWGTWTLAALFLLRGIGDFRLVGFFKRVRGTRFARRDTRLYSPLCLALALAVVAAGYDAQPSGQPKDPLALRAMARHRAATPRTNGRLGMTA
jgi:hypothetical protein